MEQNHGALRRWGHAAKLCVIATRSSHYTCLITSPVCFPLPPHPGKWGLLLGFVVRVKNLRKAKREEQTVS